MTRRTAPTALKLIRGNPGKRALNKDEPKPPPARPLAPEFLNDDAKEEWERVIGTLFNLGIMTELDRAALGAYCQAYGRWAQAERALTRMAEKDGLNRAMMVKTTNGNAIQNPLLGIANKAKDDVVKHAIEFGMTPSARAKVSASPDDPSQNHPLTEFFG